ncbi:MAG: alanine racemase [Legionellales bacterium]|nr:alanine racemase [Legionellales bacterium]
MSRPTFLYIDADALRHNVARIKQYAPTQSILAMVKADAYGCGMQMVLPILEPLVDAFGVACLEEARVLRQICLQKECVLMQGLFAADDMPALVEMRLSTVIHNPQQLTWLTTIPAAEPIKIWVKIDTGMHRLGFHPRELAHVLAVLRACPWIDQQIGLMTHLGCADTPELGACQQQLHAWELIAQQHAEMPQSVANSAAIVALPQTHADRVRPGLLLYGASPFADCLGTDLGLQPVMHFISTVTTIHEFLPGDAIGYGATWACERPSVIGVIPVGYGDGYPRHIKANTQVWVNGQAVPIVGRISMDMMAIDLTDCPIVKIGDRVELWGKHIPIEVVAHQANTIAYELMTQVTQRVGKQYLE